MTKKDAFGRGFTSIYKLLFLIPFLYYGCKAHKRVVNLVEPDLVLLIQQDSGTNASSVAYNTDKNLYYTCFAGNSKYPLETFSSDGRAVFMDKCGMDIRGMWYNPNNKYLEMNGYNNTGIRTSLLNEEGWASNTIYTLIPRGNQPYPNSCPAYDYNNNDLIYYSYGYLLVYNRDDLEFKSTIGLELPCDTSRINSSTPIYTGIEKQEVGVFNYKDKEVYLFDRATGKLTRTYKIPSHVPTTKMLNFSYCNGKLWFFNRTKREWWGFNI